MESVLTTPMAIADRDLCVTSSIGLALYPPDGTDPSTLNRVTDLAICAHERCDSSVSRQASVCVRASRPDASSRTASVDNRAAHGQLRTVSVAGQIAGKRTSRLSHYFR
jgi:hypothetical protein